MSRGRWALAAGCDRTEYGCAGAARLPRRQLAVLVSPGDRPADWLRAGQAMERVLLLATATGVRSSLLHQAVKWPDLRWMLRDPRTGPGYVQMLIRLGYGPEGAASPRADASAVLES
ncbi:hypothetical protein [Streptacidiphilus monticola]|uniref:Nitroreductase domain-containing protein n=1 Tax=Streptacidiphilus monticola TaxID=2161674 RepID=A0ABW1FWW7_9ACTN